MTAIAAELSFIAAKQRTVPDPLRPLSLTESERSTYQAINAPR